MVGASCTAELIQDDPGGLASALDLPIPVIPLELPAYQRKETGAPPRPSTAWCAPRPAPARGARTAPARRAARCNILGPTALGFRHRDDLREVRELLAMLGVEVHVVALLGASPADLARLPEADFNVVLYPEVAGVAAQWLERQWKQPPDDRGADRRRRDGGVHRRSPRSPASTRPRPWPASSGAALVLALGRLDLPHRQARVRVRRRDARRRRRASRRARWASASSARHLQPRTGARGPRGRHRARPGALVTDDYLEVEARIAELQPELVLGTQMERHIAKRLGIRAP